MVESRNFKISEFRCKHCGEVKVSPLLIGVLQIIRDKANEAQPEGAEELKVIINSGYRCEEHNRAVGGVPNSTHRLGIAADIYIPGWDAGMLLEHIKRLHLSGEIYVGYAYIIANSSRAVHVDVRYPPTNAVKSWGRRLGE